MKTTLRIAGTALLTIGLGLTPARAEEESAPRPVLLGISAAMQEGRLVVTDVSAGLPADKAGVKPGDRILEAEGKEISSLQDLVAVLSKRAPGDELRLKLGRGDETIEARATLIARPARPTRTLGIKDKPAPAWKLKSWVTLPEGKKALDVKDFRGKVLFAYCFQSWCPGCHSKGFPTLKAVKAHYDEAKDEGVAFVVIQTVFEGFETNTPERGTKVLEKFELDLPYGFDGAPDARSTFMRDYRTGGTPWTVIVDPEGVVRFNDFTIEKDAAIALIDRLKPEPAKGENGE